MRKVSKALAIILALCLCLAAVPVSAAADARTATLTYRDITINVDGTEIVPTDVNGKHVDPFIIDGTTYLPVRALAKALGSDVSWNNATSTVAVTSGTEAAQAGHTLKAGAGIGTMVFPEEYFAPTVSEDGKVTYEDGFYGKVHTFAGPNGEVTDNLATRVLLLEDEIRVALVAVEVAQSPDDQVAYTKQIVSEICGVPEENVWLHTTHQFGFMHRPSDTAKAAIYDEQMKKAVTEAATQAMESFQPAVLGVGVGESHVSANKNITRPDGVAGGPYYGPGSTLETNPTMTVLRFDSAETGKPIGFFLSYGTKPSALCTTGKTVGNREVNTEVTGQASKWMEETFGAPAMFCMPAAGDQYPRETAMYYGFDANGEWKVIDIGFDEGIKIVDRLGKEMGEDAIKIAKAITCDTTDADISIAATAFNYPNKTNDGEIAVPADAITLGDIAFVGFKQEMDTATEAQIWAASPYKTNLLVSFLNGDGKYFGHLEAYDFNNGVGTWETARSPFAKGAAEKYVEVITGVLNELKAGGEKKTGSVEETLYYRDIKITVNGNEIVPVDETGKVVEPFIIDGTTYLPVRAVANALGCEIAWSDETGTVGVTSPKNIPFQVGAGAAPIKFNAAMFPIEGFSGEVNDDPYARVLVLNNKGSKVAIVSLEMVNASGPAIDICKEVVSATNGVAPEDIWVHATHAITTMHAPSEADKNELYLESIRTAITAAAKQAAETYQPAKMGIGTAELDVNANRDLKIGNEWYYGMGSDMPSNKTMTILRFDSVESGKPIGFFISYGIKPTSIDNTGMSDNIRKISADVPGVASVDMEKEFNVPAMFCMPAAGEQIPKEVSYYYDPAVLDENGKPVIVQRPVDEAVEVMEKQGHQMGDACIALAKNITANETDPEIIHAVSSFTFANKAGDGEVEIVVEGIQLGEDLAFVGLKPETNAVTELQLWEQSPYKHTLIVSFLNGDQKYMPDADAYDLNTWEAKRAGGAKGTAEEFVKTAVQLLKDIQAGTATSAGNNGAGTGSGADGTYSTVEFGGLTWYVLDQKAGESLLLSKDILEHRAYHNELTAVTWETSDIRAYLNGDFLWNTFNDEERSLIIGTTIENRSNSRYGIAGGNATMDKIFLLSLNEAETYLMGYSTLLNAQDKDTGEIGWWHLRSPGEATDANACVTATGLIDYHGVQGGLTDPTGGVRPAMWVKLG